MTKYWLYLLIMALVTYLIRMIPFVTFRKKITNPFFRSFLHYIPYTVLTAMTVPAIFSATGTYLSAAVGFVVAVVLAYKEKGLIIVAICASVAVFCTDLLCLWI